MKAVEQQFFLQSASNLTVRYFVQYPICMKHRPQGGISENTYPILAHTVYMDYIKRSPEGKKYCLVLVDPFTRLIELFPTSKVDAIAVAKL